MGLIDEIKAETQEIASERGLSEDKAFGYWFLEKYEDLSPEEAEDTITDGPWDRGRDAVYVDEDNKVLKIYQFKYSEDPSYVRGALTDLQNGVIAEENRLKDVDALDLIVVTLASADQIIEDLKGVRRRIKNWLTRHKYNVDLRLEVIDLKRFRELSERLFGVDVTLTWRAKHIEGESAIIGLLDASGLQNVIGRDELFSFNIRRFLGFHKGSVSWKMRETLKDEEQRDSFWILNNGIVCLCTSFEPKDDRTDFKNFTIVNGAQTINTIIKFLEENPAVEEPIWVVAKVLKVREEEIDWAAKITESSNTQTPTSTRDLKAVDRSHMWIESQLRDEFNLSYLYKRGQRGGRDSVRMKDLAQAYVAFWCQEPHVAFARPGQIFAREEYYEEVFPPAQIEELKERGDRTRRREFLLLRLLPWKIVLKGRDFIRSKTGPGTLYDKKFRSLTYHMTWIYSELLEEELCREGVSKVYSKIDKILDKTLDQLFEALCDFFINRGTEIPRSLKSEHAQNELRSIFTSTPRFQKIKALVRNV